MPGTHPLQYFGLGDVNRNISPNIITHFNFSTSEYTEICHFDIITKQKNFSGGSILSHPTLFGTSSPPTFNSCWHHWIKPSTRTRPWATGPHLPYGITQVLPATRHKLLLLFVYRRSCPAHDQLSISVSVAHRRRQRRSTELPDHQQHQQNLASFCCRVSPSLVVLVCVWLSECTQCLNSLF